MRERENPTFTIMDSIDAAIDISGGLTRIKRRTVVQPPPGAELSTARGSQRGEVRRKKKITRCLHLSAHLGRQGTPKKSASRIRDGLSVWQGRRCNSARDNSRHRKCGTLSDVPAAFKYKTYFHRGDVEPDRGSLPRWACGRVPPVVRFRHGSWQFRSWWCAVLPLVDLRPQLV